MKYLLCAVLAAAMVIASIPSARVQPVQEQWIDLRADSIIFSYPHVDSIRVEALFTILTSSPRDTFYFCHIGVFLDGIPVEISELEIDDLMGPCFGKAEADCDGPCTEIIDGKTKEGTCIFWKDPHDTVFAACVCSVGIRSIWGFPYASQNVLSLELDLGGEVMEIDETNNFYSMNIGVVENEKSTWGRIKKSHDE
ncbi:MAG: hypothetical protein JXB45_03175 [Candidatus Krumholzibacteriota bacterium]|nr:hypothetical protein [Candidatus Krumholzibacteriota bacterium]